MESNRLRLQTSSSSATADWGKYITKQYLHFDRPVNIKHMVEYIENRDIISSHSFLPFVHFDITFNKYISVDIYNVENCPLENPKEIVTKTRKIMYASHKDQFIYKYYGDYLNNKYNDYAEKHGIDEHVLAYRNNKLGKNNIDFAAEVFQFMLAHKDAMIISLDFTNFFDKIDHKFLKRNLKAILDVDELPEDIYHVFKNTTKYSYVSKSDINTFLKDKYGEDELKRLLHNRELKHFMSDSEYRIFKQKNLYKNKKPYGIPQGSGMSAVCSNIHLIHFDQDMAKLAQKHHGLYRRYSDDIILIFPITSTKQSTKKYEKDAINIVKKYANHGLAIQEKKTEIRFLKDNVIYDQNMIPAALDYLGFVTNGSTVQIREKSLFKYYSRAYRKAKVCRNITLKTGKKYERKKLYSIYTHLGRRYKKHGNFISYANKAHIKMENVGLDSNIQRQIKRHWNKIQRVLNG